MFRSIALLVSATLIGCSSTPVMNGIMQSWEGARLDEVIQRWGYPTSEREIAGRKLYTWDRTGQLQMPGYMSGSAQRVGSTVFFDATTTAPRTTNLNCTRILEVKADRVVGWEWEGNNCPIMEVSPPWSEWRRKQ